MRWRSGLTFSLMGKRGARGPGRTGPISMGKGASSIPAWKVYRRSSWRSTLCTTRTRNRRPLLQIVGTREGGAPAAGTRGRLAQAWTCRIDRGVGYACAGRAWLSRVRASSPRGIGSEGEGGHRRIEALSFRTVGNGRRVVYAPRRTSPTREPAGTAVTTVAEVLGPDGEALVTRGPWHARPGVWEERLFRSRMGSGTGRGWGGMRCADWLDGADRGDPHLSGHPPVYVAVTAPSPPTKSQVISRRTRCMCLRGQGWR